MAKQYCGYGDLAGASGRTRSPWLLRQTSLVRDFMVLPVSRFLTEIRTKSLMALKSDIDPRGRVTSPSAERHTVLICSAYDARLDHSSNGADPAISRASMATRVWPRLP